MDPITMAMLEEAAMTFAKDQAMQAMGPELASMQAIQGTGVDIGGQIGGLLGQTQAPQMFNQTPPGTMLPEAAQTTASTPGVMDTLKENVMSDLNKSTLGQAYNTVTNPNATAKDYASLGYKVAFSPEAEKQNQVQMPNMQISGGYGGRVNTSGGIPDLLKQYGYNPGLLQYLG